MNIFKTFRLRWWQAGLLTLNSDVAWRMLLLVLFVLSTASILYIWWKQ